MKYYFLAAGVLGVSAIFAVTMSPYRDNEFKNAPASIEGCKDPAVAAVIYSIKNHPTKWSSDQYRLNHYTGASIWIANEDYGLSINPDGEARPDQYVMSEECQQVLYSTINTWTRNNVNTKLRGK